MLYLIILLLIRLILIPFDVHSLSPQCSLLHSGSQHSYIPLILLHDQILVYRIPQGPIVFRHCQADLQADRDPLVPYSLGLLRPSRLYWNPEQQLNYWFVSFLLNSIVNLASVTAFNSIGFDPYFPDLWPNRFAARPLLICH